MLCWICGNECIDANKTAKVALCPECKARHNARMLEIRTEINKLMRGGI